MPPARTNKKGLRWAYVEREGEHMSAVMLYWLSQAEGKDIRQLKRCALLLPMEMILRSAPTVILAEPLPEDDTEALEALEVLTGDAIARTDFGRGYVLAYERICNALGPTCINNTMKRRTA